jgi:hypothetical protein
LLAQFTGQKTGATIGDTFSGWFTTQCNSRPATSRSGDRSGMFENTTGK